MISDLIDKARRKVRFLRDTRIDEVSLVKSPANADARIALFKRGDDEMTAKLTKDVQDVIAEAVREEVAKQIGGDLVQKAVAESLAGAVEELRKADRQPVKKALDEIETLAADLIAKSGLALSPAQAMARVIKARPDLYAQHRRETAAARGDPRYAG